MKPQLLPDQEPEFDAREALRWVIARCLQGITIAWVIIGALGSVVLVYLSLRLAYVVILAFEKVAKAL